MKTSVSSAQIVKIDGDGIRTQPDLVSVEEPLEMRLGYGTEEDRNKKSISITMRTPGHDFELALGFLYTEGIISGPDDLNAIRYCSEPESEDAVDNVVIVELKTEVEVDFKKLERHFYTTSSCGVCGKASIEAVQNANCPVIEKKQGMVEASLLHTLPEALRAQQAVFQYTGGIHGCAFFNTQGDLLKMREDVGRHNALDKLIGASLASSDSNMPNSVLLLSGRISFELVQKAAMAAVPIIAAVGAPSSLAVKSAEELGITLIGFLRDKRFNIYTHRERIAL